LLHLAAGRPQAAGSIRRLGKRIARISDFRKEIVRQYLRRRRRRHPPSRFSPLRPRASSQRRSRPIEGRSGMRPSAPFPRRPSRRGASHRSLDEEARFSRELRSAESAPAPALEHSASESVALLEFDHERLRMPRDPQQPVPAPVRPPTPQEAPKPETPPDIPAPGPDVIREPKPDDVPETFPPEAPPPVTFARG
jgi:hypothetical protein